MDLYSILLWIISIIFLIAGISGLILPLLPGPLLIFTGLVLAAWAENFQYIGWGTIVTLLVLTLLAHAIDFVAGGLGVERTGASRRATWGAIIGALIGIFFGLPGIILGPFIGAFIGEISLKKESQLAAQAGVAAWIGIIIGIAAKIAFGVAMIGIYLFVRFFLH